MKTAALVLFICCSCFSYGQNKSEPDSLRIYKKVEEVAKKKKSTFWLYNAIFNLPDGKKKKEKERKQVTYDYLRGKIIRRVEIQTFDPFGYSINDTSRKPHGFIQKGLNLLHQKSAKFAIYNRLLYQRGDSLDPLKVKESERVLRQTDQIHEIRTEIRQVKNTDSVDVFIRSQDVFSKSFGIAYQPDRYTFDFTDRNFLGLGHFFQNDFSYYPYRDLYVVSGRYSIPYIGNTLIIPTVNYNSDPDNFFRGVNISRPFISPLFSWAGSVSVYDSKSSGNVVNPENNLIFSQTRNFVKDLWLGHSFRLSKDTSEEVRVTRLITGARYSMITYNYHPSEEVAPLHFYENTNLLLVNVGLTNRSYYRDYFVYRFGVQEDVPSGRILNLTGGYEWRGSGNRWYMGIEAGAGNHFDNFGYLTTRASFGTFIKNNYFEQSVFNISMGYFSDLLKVNRTHFRQFAKFGVTYGLNRFRSESVSLAGDIRGLESDFLKGTKKATLSLQTQCYLPFEIIGFRFAPFFFIGFGLLADKDGKLIDSQLLQGYGFGLLIKNELLVIKTFQIAIGFYPFIPEKNGASVRLNPYKTYDFAFADFDIQAPSVIPLQ
jgi:hypothetical protein